ncbi:hypothetical protein UlMin_009765 [Ulmus minor]
MSENQRDRLMKIAMENWSKSGDSTEPKKQFDLELRERKTVPFQRVMIWRSVSTWKTTNFDPEAATFEHVMSMMLMINGKVRELSIKEKTNYLVFMINAFQVGLTLFKSPKYCLNHETNTPITFIEESFLFHIIIFISGGWFYTFHFGAFGILDSKFSELEHTVDGDGALIAANNLGQVDDACVLYCERFMEFLIDLLSQLPTRSYNICSSSSSFFSCLYLRPLLVADVAVVAKCHLSALDRREKGKLFAQLVDLLQFYEGFEINDHVGTQLTDDELRGLASVNIGAINKRNDLTKKLGYGNPSIEAITSGILPGLTMVVGPPGTGKTDTAVQILNILYYNCRTQRMLIITHSNQALNDLFEKIMQWDVPAHYLLRLGQGEQELATDLYLAGKPVKVERLARFLQLPEDVGYTCETAGFFWLLHFYSCWEQCLAACAEIANKPSFTCGWLKGVFRWLKTMFQELEECRAFEFLKSTADRANFLMTYQAKIIAMTCTHAGLKSKDFLYSHMDHCLLTRLVRLGIPYIELNAQGRARPSIAKLYNWRYIDFGDLAYLREAAIFHRANAGFSYDYQLADCHLTWFYQNEGEAGYLVSVFIYMGLLRYPANKISILTTYNWQKLLIRDVINRMFSYCIDLFIYLFFVFVFFPQVATVDKFQGWLNDFILLSLVRTWFVGHLCDFRRLVVAIPDHLALNLTEVSVYTERHVEDTGPVHLVNDVDDMNIIYQQLYQAKIGQYMAYSGRVAPGLIEPMAEDVDGVRESGPDGNNTEDETKMEVLANGENGDVQSESH